MAMQEFDGSMGEPSKDLKKMLSEAGDENIKATHFGQLGELDKLKKDVEAKTITHDDFRRKQLDRIEGMLTSIILHFGVPHKGILTIPNTGRSGISVKPNLDDGHFDA